MTKYYISTYYINAYLNRNPSMDELLEVIHLLLYIGAKDETLMFDRMEEKIKEYLEKFQHTGLREYIPFQEDEIPLERLGEFFFEALGDLLKQQKFPLYQLEIYRTPMRKYKISDRLLLPFQYPKDVVKRIEHMQEWNQGLYADIEEKQKENGFV